MGPEQKSMLGGVWSPDDHWYVCSVDRLQVCCVRFFYIAPFTILYAHTLSVSTSEDARLYRPSSMEFRHSSQLHPVDTLAAVPRG